MRTGIRLGYDFSADAFRCLVGRCEDDKQARHLLSLAAVYDGMSREDAARIGGMHRRTLYEWVHRLNAEGSDCRIDREAPGRQRYLSDAQMAELSGIVEAGPDPTVEGVSFLSAFVSQTLVSQWLASRRSSGCDRRSVRGDLQ